MIAASWLALEEAVTYGLLRAGYEPDVVASPVGSSWSRTVAAWCPVLKVARPRGDVQAALRGLQGGQAHVHLPVAERHAARRTRAARRF